MKFCNKCGHKLDDDQKFCTKCGAPTPSASAGSDVHIPPRNNAPQPSDTVHVPMPQNVPQPQGSTANSGTPAVPDTNAAIPAPPEVTTTAPTAATTAVKTTSKKRLIIIIAAIVAVALVAVGAGFGTYKAQLWGGKTVPNPADLGVVKSSKTHEFTAADVEASLHKRGFKTTIKQTFSAKPKGSFIGYNNIQANKRYSTGNPITVFASNGPGVPQGTHGQSVRKIQKSVASMGVPVHYYKVIVTDQKTPADTVIASYPADGQAVSDTKTGINIGVAEQGNGVGYDIVGQDKNQAQQQYASAGFNVTLKPRFSSKARIGKIVDSNPKPGSEANGGNLTLYYGIDASGFKDAVSGKNAYPNDSYAPADGLVGSAAPVTGKYCTTGSDCIDFTDNSSSPGEMPTTVSSEFPAQKSKDFGKTLLFCGSTQQAYCPTEDGRLQSLYTKGSGAIELAPYQTAIGYECGGVWQEDGGCVNGKFVGLDEPGGLGQMSGATYDMGPLYIYFPVGSDMSKVTGANYFDKDALAQAQKKKAVDTSRPFFIRRDKKLYDKTSIPMTSFSTLNPFAPTFAALSSQKLEPFKPAPSDETAYYLVEGPQLDWGSLPEYVIGGDNSSKDTAKGNDNDKAAQPTTKDPTPDDIVAATTKGDFSPIAGNYCNESNECIALDKTGLLTGNQNEKIPNGKSQLILSTPENTNNTWGSYAYPAKPNAPFVHFHGSDSEAVGSTPTNIIYVFKGSDTSGWYTEGESSIPNPDFNYNAADGITPAPTDRPYLTFLNGHSTTLITPPSKEGVFYLQQ
ncbi:PASTA domain-containing protein [Bifidobacterium sp. ESL0769]|uniref:PASTA domain-containing protein n=1 Tax=Bifidobacterium sp. ESL0769 TaxID=2983229 RepID=UPI0023F68975|nr:PASTA domain-containing protein [Bifidobacterium sp. ESL0769]WEV67400.1 PASTA domain-containing protein [Bifidobacterium sp. ESL0769]